MDFNLHELGQVAQFKESVLSAADAVRAKIIADAQRQSDGTLEGARLKSRLADHETVVRKLSLEADRQASAATQTARRQLLATRQTLVDGVFREVEEKLLAFTQTEGYGAWLAQKLAAHAPALAGAKEEVTVLVREADMPHAAALQKALPGCTVRAGESIRLGGLKLVSGYILYDETLDCALEEERENFYNTSGLYL